MASNKTPNLNLDVWAEMDYFKRAELNSNFDKLDGNVGSLTKKTQGIISVTESVYDKLKVAVSGGWDYAPAINAALSSSYKYIFVPDGDYLVNSSILIPSNTTLVLSYNATIIRNFSGRGSSIATIRNKSLSNTNRDKNIGLFGGIIKAADSTKTGKHIVFWGIDVLRLSQITIRDTFDDWTTNFRDCYDTQGKGFDIDTLGSQIFTDGIHITGGKRYVFSDLLIKSGDDCISLTVETAEDTDIDGVVINNAILTTKRSSIIKMTTKTGTTPTIKNIKLLNVIGSSAGVLNTATQAIEDAGETIVIKDEDNTGRISNITLDVTADAIHGAGAGCRIQGVNNLNGKVSVINPQGKGADLTYINGGKLTVEVSGQRTNGVSAVTTGAITDFDLTPIIDGAKLHGVAVGALANPSATPPTPDMPVTNSRIINGRVKGSVNTDIRLVNANGVKVDGNYCSGASGIVEDTGCDWNAIRNNDVRNVTGTTKIAVNGTNTTIPNSNSGYKTYNRGTFSIPAASTSVVVPHGLATAPSGAGVQITLTSGKGSAKDVYVDTTLNTATNFTVKTDVAPGSIITFMWTAVTSKY